MEKKYSDSNSYPPNQRTHRLFRPITREFFVCLMNLITFGWRVRENEAQIQVPIDQTPKFPENETDGVRRRQHPKICWALLNRTHAKKNFNVQCAVFVVWIRTENLGNLRAKNICVSKSMWTVNVITKFERKFKVWNKFDPLKVLFILWIVCLQHFELFKANTRFRRFRFSIAHNSINNGGFSFWICKNKFDLMLK